MRALQKLYQNISKLKGIIEYRTEMAKMGTCLKQFCKKSLRRFYKDGEAHPIIVLAYTDEIILEVREMLKGEMLENCDIMLSTHWRTYENCKIYRTRLILQNHIRVLVFIDNSLPNVVQVTVRCATDYSPMH